ncbi:MAG TPA: MBL fold metallo-hydrolase, partial [Thermoanaerobaculia bacterium]|nr:MBL fold metallo-hydrolase [Thermoanaerobaculia bacterium]
MTLRRVTMLGSGTSSGVPVIGCTCPVCTSADPRNRRLRASVRLELAGGTVLVDTSPDLREQALRSGLDRLDAILFTHAHADHLFGLDDVRIFNFRQRAAIPCFGSPATLERVRTAFSYVFEEGQE